MLCQSTDQFLPAFHLNLHINIMGMGFHGSDGNIQFPADLRGRLIVKDTVQDLDLPGRKFEFFCYLCQIIGLRRTLPGYRRTYCRSGLFQFLHAVDRGIQHNKKPEYIFRKIPLRHGEHIRKIGLDVGDQQAVLQKDGYAQ